MHLLVSVDEVWRPFIVPFRAVEKIWDSDAWFRQLVKIGDMWMEVCEGVGEGGHGILVQSAKSRGGAAGVDISGKVS